MRLQESPYINLAGDDRKSYGNIFNYLIVQYF